MKDIKLITVLVAVLGIGIIVGFFANGLVAEMAYLSGMEDGYEVGYDMGYRNFSHFHDANMIVPFSWEHNYPLHEEYFDLHKLLKEYYKDHW